MRRFSTRVCAVLVGLWLLNAPLRAQSFSQRFDEIEKSATKDQLYGFLYDLPKGGDLHHHLGLSYFAERWFDGATDMRRTGGNQFYTRTRVANCAGDTEPPLLFQTIQRSTYGSLSDCRKGEYQLLSSLAPPLKQEWISAMKLDAPGEGRDEFFERIPSRLNELFRDPYLVTDLLVDNMKLMGAEGVRYIEAQALASGFQDQDGRSIDVERGVQFFRDRLNQEDARATGVTVRFQGGILRYAPQAEQDLEQAYAFVNSHRDLWVGINMLGREDTPNGSALRFLDTFRKMRRTYSGIGLALHGGEADSPGVQVRDTLLLGATRIGHGINLITDPETMLLMRDGKALIEINLISNHLLEYVPDLSRHPFPEYLRTGIPVCLNTDDRGSFDSNLTDEYFTAVTTFTLTWDEIVGIGRNSLTFSFAEPAVKDRLVREYDAAVQRFQRKYGSGSWRDVLKTVRAVPSGYATRRLGIAAR